MAQIWVLTGADPNSDRPDERDGWVQVREVSDALTRRGHRVTARFVGADLRGLPRRGEPGCDAVFNLVEALGGDGRHIDRVPAALAAEGIPFTGASAAAMAATTDKLSSKQRLRDADLPTPAWSADGTGLDPALPVIVKSVHEDASFGLDAHSVVTGADAASKIAREARRWGGAWFAEAYIDGREFNLSLIEIGGSVRVLPVAEIEFRDYAPEQLRLVDYEAKWNADSFGYRNTVRTFLTDPKDAPLIAELSRIAVACWDLFDLTGYARVDFRVDRDGSPFVLEVNANPCLSSDAGFMAAAARAGLSPDDVIRHVLASAGVILDRAA